MSVNVLSNLLKGLDTNTRLAVSDDVVSICYHVWGLKTSGTCHIYLTSLCASFLTIAKNL